MLSGTMIEESSRGPVPLDKEVILFDGFGITASDLVPPGTVAIMFYGGEVQLVPVESLRATIEQLGSQNVEGLSMAPSDFDKVEAVIKRRSEESGIR